MSFPVAREKRTRKLRNAGGAPSVGLFEAGAQGRVPELPNSEVESENGGDEGGGSGNKEGEGKGKGERGRGKIGKKKSKGGKKRKRRKKG